jgi:hypothetical protein
VGGVADKVHGGSRSTPIGVRYQVLGVRETWQMGSGIEALIPFRNLCLEFRKLVGESSWSRIPCVQLASIKFYWTLGAVAQLGERLICIQEVAGSIPTSSTRFCSGGLSSRLRDCVSKTVVVSTFAIAELGL